MLSLFRLLKALGFRKREGVRIWDQYIRGKTRAEILATVDVCGLAFFLLRAIRRRNDLSKSYSIRSQASWQGVFCGVDINSPR